MNALQAKIKKHERRKAHIRLSISGTAERPRISVFRSNLHLSGQVINDEKGVTLCSVSTVQSEYKNLRNNTEGAAILGDARQSGAAGSDSGHLLKLTETCCLAE